MRANFACFGAVLALLAAFPAQAQDEEGTFPLGDPLAADAFEFFPVGQPWENVRVPKYSEKGELQSIMHTRKLIRESEFQLKMEGLTILMLNERGEPALRVTTEIGVYNLTTAKLKSRSEAYIQHERFDMTGDRLEFDTRKQTGTLNGNVEMIIYDTGDLESPITPNTSPDSEQTETDDEP